VVGLARVEAFLYTPDYPASVDLTVTDVQRASAGGLDVSIHNGGRPGTVTLIRCNTAGHELDLGLTALINPVQTQIIHLNALSARPGEGVMCTVSGVNEDGSPEANTSNNVALLVAH